MDSRERIENDGLVWIVVASIGFVFGLGWLTGPLAWIFGGRLHERARRLAINVPGQARAARVVGIVTTILTILAALAYVVVVVFMGWLLINGLKVL